MNDNRIDPAGSKNKTPEQIVAEAKARASASVSSGMPEPGVVRLGRATGKLAERGHASCPPEGAAIDLDLDAQYAGTLVVGPSGSGKTRAVLQPHIAWFLRAINAALFAFGVKPNWSKKIADLARYAGRREDQIRIIGPGHEPWSMMRGLPPESVATWLAAAFERDGSKKGGDQFFTDGAVNAGRRAAQIAYAATACAERESLAVDVLDASGAVVESRDLGYDLASMLWIAQAVRDADAWAALATAVSQRVARLAELGDEDASEMLDGALEALDAMLVGRPEKTVDGILMQLATVIDALLSQAPLRRAFCGEDDGFDFGAALEAGQVVILDVDLIEYGVAARLAYLLAFESLRVAMQRRIARAARGEELNPIAFVADEYAEVASKEHAKLFRVCREACVAPIVAYQLQSDLRAQLGGSDRADGLTAGMRTKIVFRTDDPASVRIVGDALGKAEVERAQTSSQTGDSQNFQGAFVRPSGGAGRSESASESSTTQVVERLVVDAQLVQSLRSDIRRAVPIANQIGEAIVITDRGSARIADVVEVRPFDPPIKGETK
jgi:hypothetical protein